MQNVLPPLSVSISPLDAMYIEVFPQFRLPDIKIAISDKEPDVDGSRI